MDFVHAIKRGLGITKKIKDPVFGEMDVNFIKVKGKKITYFNCEKYFSPKKINIQITIYNDGKGPDAKQKEIYEKFERDYTEIIRRVNTKIYTEYKEDAETFKVINFDNDYIIESLYIHSVEDNTCSWDIEYSLKTNDRMYIEVSFENETIDYIDIYTL